MFINFEPMFLMSQRRHFPHVHDREPDLVEMVSNVQHRIMNVNLDAAEHYFSAVSTAPEDSDTEQPQQTGLEQGDDSVELSVVENSDSRPIFTCTDNTNVPKFTSLGIEEGVSPVSDVASPLAVAKPGRTGPVDEIYGPNIIIFGEAGVGKSSVVNLLAGQKRAHISNDALGCTFQYQRHIVVLKGKPFSFWDTTGLDEGSKGTVPANLAESNLRALIRGLAHSGGIHLVIYCTRGTRLTKALKYNYDLFYTTICRKKVPVALVVTGLEHQEGDMETWWDKNEEALQRCGMWFHAHACVTTLDVNDAVILARRLDSQRRLRDLVLEYAARRPWKIEASLISWTTLRNSLRRVPSTSTKAVRRVMVCDRNTSSRSCRRTIGDRKLVYELVYVDDPLNPLTSSKSASALVFYTSPLHDSSISPDDVNALKTFHDAAGGAKCPMIVVLRGCHDDQVARNCWDAVASDIQAWPTVDEPAKLDAMIEEQCIEVFEGKPSIFHRVYEAVVGLIAAVVRWQDLFV